MKTNDYGYGREEYAEMCRAEGMLDSSNQWRAIGKGGPRPNPAFDKQAAARPPSIQQLKNLPAFILVGPFRLAKPARLMHCKQALWQYHPKRRRSTHVSLLSRMLTTSTIAMHEL